jgi:hypothetical protein
MAQSETCEIKLVKLRDGGGFFRGGCHISRYEAQKMTSSGSTTIFRTDSFEIGPGANKEQNEKRILEYKKMIANLGNEGWEASSYGRDEFWREYEERRITTMKRRISAPGSGSTDNTANSADLLKQLAALRDAGILTEQEFQTKKAEILKRI